MSEWTASSLTSSYTSSLLSPYSSLISSTSVFPLSSTYSSPSIDLSTPIPTPTPTLTGSQTPTRTSVYSSTLTPVDTTTPAPVDTSTQSNKGHSNGVVAGVAIGCFAVGALLAGFVIFFLFQRKRSRPESRYQQSTLPPKNGPEKGLAAASRSSQGVGAYSIDDLLPMPVEDDAIRNELSKIRDNIKNHVRTYYHFEAVPPNTINGSQLSGLATATGVNASTLMELLLSAPTRSEVIRLYIAWVAMSRCSGDRYPNFLPDEIAKMAMFAPGNSGRNSVHPTLFSKWKVISGALLQTRYGQPLQIGDSRARSVDEAIREVDSVLQTLIAPNANAAHRRNNLEMIMGRSTQLAFLLFSQPGSFQFDFSRTDRTGSLVVFPGLRETVEHGAQHVRPHGRSILEKEVVTDLRR